MKQKRILSIVLVLVMLLTIALDSMTVSAEGETADDFDKLREKWQYIAMGGDYDPKDPNMQELLHAINNVAQDLLDRINPSPTPGWGANDYLWKEYILGNRGSAYSDSNNTQFSIRSLKFMALAFQTKGCELYQNEKLKVEILRGLDYIYKNHYKVGVDTNAYGNWFTWEIGGPIYLLETILLMYDYLPADQIQAYAATALKATTKTGGDSYMYVGANALWRDRVRMYSAILLKDSATLTYVQKDVPSYMGYVKSGDGYYEDGTFMQHGNVVYNGGYGKEAFSDISHFIYMLDNSPWEITGPERDNMSTIVEKSYIPFMYNGVFMDMVRGREITRTDTTDAYAGITISLDVLLFSESVSENEGKRLKGMIKEWMNNENAIHTLNEGAGVAWYMFPVYNLSKTLEILKDDSIKPVSNAGKSYTFGKGVRTVHTTDKFTFGLSMYSRDITTYEVGDSNTKGWYTGLGETYIYTPDVGQFTYQKPTLNWYRLPGVTAVNGTTVGSHTNSNAFAGSTTLNGTYSTAGLEISSGSTKVSAKKSWFMFDDEVVALGTDITSAQDKNVETTIDNHYITGDNALIVNGERQPDVLGWNGKIDNARWALIEGNAKGSNIGVYFPKETRIGAVRETRTGKWTDLGSYNVDDSVQSANYLTMWIDHGSKPVNDSYAYVLLPGKTEAQVENYASSSDTEIIRQDNDVHAVYEKTLHTLGVNFWKDGDQAIDAMGVEDYLSVDKASSIMIKEDDNKLSFALSDTARSSSGTITVDINRAAVGVISKDSRIKVIQTSPSIRLELDISNSFGNPIEAEFSFRKLEVPGETAITNMALSDNTLSVKYTDALRATGYKLVYGTESGNYPESLVTSGTTAEIKGLDANTTYYFAVKAINDSGEGSLSQERSYTIGDIRTLIEEFEDFSKTVSYSGGWATDSSNADTYYNGDTTRIKRNDADKTDVRREEFVTYYTPSPKDFELTTYDYGLANAGDNTILQIYGSADNKNWVSIPATKDGTVTKDKWSKVVYTNSEELDSSIRYIKIAVSNNTKVYAPQLSKLKINYAWTSDRVVMDTMLDDSRAYEVKGDAAYMTGDGVKFGGDKDILIKSGSGNATMLYSYTNMQNARLTAFIAKVNGGTVSIKSSKDGISFVPVDSSQEIDPGDYGDYNKVVYNIPELEGGTKYLLLTISGEADSIAIADLNLSYIHEIAPIEKIMFKDKQLEAVMKYNLAPAVKLAPMNATGEIIYTISDKDVARVNSSTGVLQAEGLGAAVLTATVLGTGTNVSADINVRTSQNLALNAITTASSAGSAYPANKATDGDYLSRWESSVGNAQWLQVDLGLPREFGAIELNWQQYATQYVVQGSLNGTDWVDLYTESNGKGGNVWIEFDQVQKYRYVRLSGTMAPAAYSLYEFRVLSFKAQSGPDGVVLQNLALGKTATTNGNDSSNSDPKAAIDGNTSTRWASARTDSQWYTVDLGAPCNIYQINLLWESAYGKEYDIQVYNDISNINNVVSEKNGSAGWKRYALDEPAQGRYVRMQGIKRGSTYGYSLYEFEVYGSLEQTTVSAISFASDKLTVLRNHKKTADVITDPPYLNEGSIAFVSSDPQIATVSNKGVVTGITTGSAIIMAYSAADDSVNASCDVTVTDYNGAPIPVSSLEVQGGAAIIEKGTSAQFDAVIAPDNASIKNIHWTSSDERVILVNNEGLIRAIGVGTAVVRGVSVANPELVYEQEIRVIDAEVETVKALINAIGVVTLQSKGDIDAARAAYNKLNDDQKALVDNYEVLTAAETQYEQLLETERVTGVKLNTLSMYMAVGDSGQLTATVSPSSAVNKNVTWSSSNSNVAAVDANGMVTAVGAGTAVITVTTEDGGKTAACSVTVRSGQSDGGSNPDGGNSGGGNTGGSNSGGGSSSGTPVTPPPALPVENAPGTVQVSAPAVNSAGVATTTIDAEALAKALKTYDTAIINVPKAEGASAYETVLPAAALTSENASKKIEITTELGKVTVPGNMLTRSDAAGAQSVSLIIAKTDTGVLDTAVKSQIGKRPAVELKININGSSIAWNDPEAPVIMEIPYTPTAAELADPEHIVVWYIDGAGKISAVPTGRYDSETGNVTFKTTHSGSYAVAYVRKSFTDIGEYSWASRAIEVMASKGVINGTSETTFSPSADIRRADFIVLLVKALGLSAKTQDNFADVSPGAYYAEALATAKALGITAGVGNNNFNPNAKISREDMMVLAARAMDKAGKPLADAAGSELKGYSDSAQISGYALKDVAALIKAEIIKGSGNTINPKRTATRAEAAVIIYNLYNR
ncbi:polysaccharide lyase family 8 super-sandwich domain-containing protein [Ruminiclostridium cellobioparum]|uniref:Polysaccharide lyase family protein 8 n=1 Tax=Ruminiclostridium cellobioparum subsp. termitidis CT1112 TaxID=1195236 RepID=S0FKJ7_RUMCE|nr:polysaccharide lyase family 8 super-sandwich domain-containing protein [Ruminiclostridium cellobioparum]EMS72740.1 polysaccharide lyase family protein 8 [Ruminiclostridium cellobioparum subsp. termitidis CT1112]